MATALNGGSLLKKINMKPLKIMSNTDKAHLLLTLFAQERDKLQDFIKMQCRFFLENENEIRPIWINNSSMTNELWYTLVRNVDQRINKYNKRFLKPRYWLNKSFFADQNILFILHCIIIYADFHENKSLRSAINLLFDVTNILIINYERTDES